ncbi:hypothetical protein D3C81_2338680 [compost metagenome]
MLAAASQLGSIFNLLAAMVCSLPNRIFELVSLPVTNVPSAPITGARKTYEPPVRSTID